MAERVCIPTGEYSQRIKRAAELIGKSGYDVLIANSNESDFANVRYFSGYWPLFESAGMAIAPTGQAALMIGPESENYALGRSLVQNIHLLTAYRETADPAYPGIPVSDYVRTLESIGVKNPRRIGVAGYLCTTMPMYEDLKNAFPQAEIVNADHVMTSLRQIKSPAELDCLREGLRLGEIALDAAVNAVKPGMTELQLAGVILQTLYENGAEYEAHAIYSFGGKKTNNAISRPTHRVFETGDMIQLNMGGRVDGYSPSVGRPICLGKMSDRQKELVEFGLEAHWKTRDLMKAGVIAADVATQYEAFFEQRGYKDNFLYGPCHGLGLIEVEKPWMESTSDYPLQENMTFQIDTFVTGPDFGLRWENGARVTADGVEMMSGARMEIIEVDV